MSNLRLMYWGCNSLTILLHLSSSRAAKAEFGKQKMSAMLRSFFSQDVLMLRNK